MCTAASYIKRKLVRPGDIDRSKFDVEPKRIIFQGRILNKDDQTLEACKLKDGLTVVVQAAQPGQPGAPSPVTPAVATPAPSTAIPSPAAGGGVAAAAQAMQGLGMGGGLGPMGQAVATVRSQPAGLARDCLTTLTKVIDNIIAHPAEEKYRKIKRANAGFSRKVSYNSCSYRACDGRVVLADFVAGWALLPSRSRGTAVVFLGSRWATVPLLGIRFCLCRGTGKYLSGEHHAAHRSTCSRKGACPGRGGGGKRRKFRGVKSRRQPFRGQGA